MPVVDLSRIGLEGQESFVQRMNVAAQTDRIKADTRAQQIENEQNEQLQQLNQLASQRLQSVLNGDVQPAADSDAIAKRIKSLAEPMEAVADVYYRGGAISKAMEISKAASEIRKRESDIEADQYNNQQTRLENMIKGADIAARTVGIARNESEWRQGMKELEGTGIIEPELMEQLKSMPYDPDVAAYFRDRAVQVADQARLDLQRETNDRLERQGAIEAGQMERRIRLQEARDNEVRRHNRVIEKASGGKAAGIVAPNSDELRSAKAALLSSVYSDFKGKDIESDSDFTAAADYVAAQAQQLVKQNKGMDWNTAVQQAIMRGEQAGAFGATEGDNWFLRKIGQGDESEPKFDGKGLSAQTAIPMPNSKAEMKKGRYYITSRGRALWNGKDFQLAE